MPFSSFPTSLTDAADNEVPVENIFKNFDGVTQIDVPEGVEKIGIVRMDTHLMTDLIDALSRLHCVPGGFDIIAPALMHDTSELMGTVDRFLSVDDEHIEELLERLPDSAVIYDLHGKFASIIPSSFFECSYTGRAQLKFAGNISSLARDEKIIEELQEALLNDMIRRFAQSLAGKRNTASYESTFFSAEQVFRCFTMDRLDFPVTEEDIERVMAFRGKVTSLDVFESATFDDTAFNQKIRSIEHARKTFENCLRLWDWALKVFRVPVTIGDYPMLTSDDESWDTGNMSELGNLIGMDIALDTLQSGVDVRDIIA